MAKKEKNIYSLKLHEILGEQFEVGEPKLDEYADENYLDCLIIRVPGGWIYSNEMGNVFVPYNKEFEYINK